MLTYHPVKLNNVKNTMYQHKFIYLMLLCVLLTGTAWGLAPLQIKYVGVEFSVGYRLLIGSLVIGVFAFLKKESFPKFSKENLILLFINAFLLYGINYILCYSALNYIPSGLVALVISAMIIPNIFFGYIVLGNKVTLKGVLGALVSLIGLVIVFFSDLGDLNLSNATLTGFCLSFSSIFLSSLGTVFGGKLIKSTNSLYWVTCFAMFMGSISVIGTGYYKHGEFLWSYDINFLLPLLYLSTFIMAFIMLIYQHMVCIYGAEKASYMWIFTPVIAIFMSTIFEDLLWSRYIVFGILLVILGSLISLLKKSNRLTKKS